MRASNKQALRVPFDSRFEAESMKISSMRINRKSHCLRGFMSRCFQNCTFVCQQNCTFHRGVGWLVNSKAGLTLGSGGCARTE